MALRWESRVRAAERLRFEASLAGRILAVLGLSGIWMQRLRFGKPRLLPLAWALAPRRLKLVAGGLVAGWLLAAVVTVVVLFAVAARLG